MTELLERLFSPLTGLISGALEFFHSMGAPWWLSIALLTVSVRVLLFPLTLRQVENMRDMQELKPHMDEIRSRYKKDRQKQQEAMMALYRKHRVNPLGGFLPVLAQVPVFITMYHVVRTQSAARRVSELRRRQGLHDRRRRMALSGAVGVHPTRQMCRRCRAHLDVPSVTITPLIWGICVGWH